MHYIFSLGIKCWSSVQLRSSIFELNLGAILAGMTFKTGEFLLLKNEREKIWSDLSIMYGNIYFYSNTTVNTYLHTYQMTTIEIGWIRIKAIVY